MLNKALSWFLCLSIRVQLLLLLMLVMAPSIVIVINSALNKRAEQVVATRADLWQMADFIITQQQEIVFAAQQLGISLAQTPEVQTHDASRLPLILVDRLKINQKFSAVVVADRAGKVIVSYPVNKNLHSIAERRSFRNAKATRLFSSGEYCAENASNNSLMSFSYPLIAADGTFNGVVDIEINRNAFQLIHKNLVFPSRPNFTIVDLQGIILYSHLYPDFVGKHDRAANFTAMQQGNDNGNFFTGQGNDGRSRLLYYRKAYLEHEATPYLYIRASKPTESLMAEADRDLLLNILALGAFTMMAFFLAGIIGKRSIADRVKVLEASALSLADGDLSVRASGLVIGGELGKLANAFDRMAGQLQDRDNLLNEFDNELITAILKLKVMNQKIEDTREEERHNIARELHDQMGQALTGLSLDLNWLVAQLDGRTAEKLNSHIIDMQITVESLIAMVQSITARLSPPLLNDLGLSPAIGHYLHDFERKSGITCHIMLDENAANHFSKEESIAIFRILQEALTNVVRHAEANEVAISLCLNQHSVVLEVADNGKGATTEALRAPDAYGVLGMQERAQKCGGTLLIQDNAGGGTIVRLEIPQTDEREM